MFSPLVMRRECNSHVEPRFFLPSPSVRRSFLNVRVHSKPTLLRFYSQVWALKRACLPRRSSQSESFSKSKHTCTINYQLYKTHDRHRDTVYKLMTTNCTIHKRKPTVPRSFHSIRESVSNASSVHLREDSGSHCFDILDLLGTSDKVVDYRLVYL
jgi:hypothetical protein